MGLEINDNLGYVEAEAEEYPAAPFNFLVLK
jgi:hypothetical protein